MTTFGAGVKLESLEIQRGFNGFPVEVLALNQDFPEGRNGFDSKFIQTALQAETFVHLILRGEALFDQEPTEESVPPAGRSVGGILERFFLHLKQGIKVLFF